ncbi:hypothetical protein BFW38_07130 [Terasakiispira papahanaumokuakeensis]|uniref:Ion-translocating oxidoreductase complex subunit C n=1 Tax=Terasakiispira papahanaumokuakeensis TaxID=197479 RepID=A0A1E2V8Q7_9GAMM|nr:electron transport complex subunit RsxC [Terasakiispira papahanaumokuakeensis]ODC03354.1 hypothetical protein BFW38_07130 [Terasakiispira papahanaumokuakeensis]
MTPDFSRVHRFHGGIQPPEHKQISTTMPLQAAALPDRVVLPLQQSSGLMAQAVVSVGDYVYRGQCIAQVKTLEGQSSALGAAVHASISGHVSELATLPVPHPGGLQSPCIVIESDGLDLPVPDHVQRQDDWQDLEAEQLLATIGAAGIVGLGGAGFPTHTKLAGGFAQDTRLLLINAAECEPYITADDMLLRQRSAALIEGIQVLVHLLEPEHVVIGIEDNKSEAIACLRAAIDDDSCIQLVVVPTRYPSGGEKQLIQLVSGLEVPSGKRPIDIGVVCQNVGTVVAVADAVIRHQPLIERVVTVTGDALAQPRNFYVRLGTSIEHVLTQAGLRPQQLQRLIMGGPMMGFALTDLSLPVVKTTNCLLAGSNEALGAPGEEMPCIRCGECEAVCPAQLLPQQLYWFSAHQQYQKAASFDLWDCIECGACAYVCPSDIPLVQYYRHAKDELRVLTDEAQKAEQARQRFEARQARLTRQAEEKAAKRAARAAKAQQIQSASKATAASQPKATSDDSLSSNATPPLSESASTSSISPSLRSSQQHKIALAAAQVALKRADKQLAAAKARREEDVTALEAKVEQAREKLKALQNVSDTLSDTVSASVTPATPVTAKASGSSTPAVSASLKQLKITRAAALSAVKKAEKGLLNLQRATDATAEQLDAQKARLAGAQEQFEAAEKALQKAQLATEPTQESNS